MRTPRRLRQRLLGPSGREARIFFTPALAAGGLVVIWVFIAFVAISDSGPDGVSPGFLTSCFLAGEPGPLSIRTAFLLLVVALGANFIVVLFGWLHEAHRDKWDAYLPWRLTAGLWAACVLALVAVLGTAVLRTPGPEDLVARAETAFAAGNGEPFHTALVRSVPGTERALRDHLQRGDVGSRFEAATMLRVTLGRDDELDSVMREAVDELAVALGMRMPDDTFDPLRKSIAAGLRRLEAELPTPIIGEALHLLERAETRSAEFFRWWRIHDRLLFP